MSTFGHQMMRFYRDLEVPELPDGVEALLPFQKPEVRHVMEKFYSRFFGDDSERILLFGINPGRFGAGITGIGFTDPIRLRENCGIDNPFEMRPETSSVFMYEMISAFGGPAKFYADFHFSAVSPIGFVSKGNNFNYYDTQELMKATRPFIIRAFEEQLQMPVCREVAFSIGKGQNYKFLKNLNSEFGFFSHIETLPHPRWVMQYRYRRKSEFIEQYIRELGSLIKR